MGAVRTCHITSSGNRISTMTSVPRLISFWESMSRRADSISRRPAFEAEGVLIPGSKGMGVSQTAEPSSPSLPAREALAVGPTGLIAEGSRTGLDLLQPPGVVVGGGAPLRGVTNYSIGNDELSKQKTNPVEYRALSSHVEEVKRIDVCHTAMDAFLHFPYRNAHKFRNRLAEKKATYDPDYVIREVIAKLGPSEEEEELKQGLENELSTEIEVRHDSTNPYTVLEDMEDDGCLRSRGLCGKAKNLVRWYEALGLTKIRDPPVSIECGGLRGAVRQCFSDVDLVWELSFKTVGKIEKSCCKFCLPRFEQKLNQWKRDRSQPKPVDSTHLRRFREAFRRNVDKGWDKARRPFVPNGNATRQFRRRDGGNWNREEFSEEFRTELVFSSGKPRIVTVYSSENTRILGPLHYSLYDSLKRKGWLLVGDPQDHHITALNGAELLSFDYSSATDNIKTEYVRTAIDVLIDEADHISDEERAALHVLGNLTIDGVRCGSGQPMGSVLSFPLLCLINKTVVDLAMNRLIEGKKISFKEWSSHRLLINGDDLLTREVRKDTNLRGLISEEGSQVGLVVNEEKTMSSQTACEINSTLFESGKKVRKFNASAVYMDDGVEDVLGFAAQATSSVEMFRKVVRWNARILAKSEDKHLTEIPPHLRVVCRKDKKIRRALTSMPKSTAPREEGVIRMAAKPGGYNLDIGEEREAMVEEIERCREGGVAWARARATRKQFRTSAEPNQRSFSQVLKKKQTAEQELIPACYVRAYVNKMRDALVEEYVAGSSSETLPPGDGSTISVLIDNLRLFKQKRAVRLPGTISEGFLSNDDFVRLD